MNPVIAILADVASRTILEAFKSRLNEVNIQLDLHYLNFFSTHEDISQLIEHAEQSGINFIFIFSKHVNSVAPLVSARSQLPVFAVEADDCAVSSLSIFEDAPYVYAGEGVQGLGNAFRFVWKLLSIHDPELARQWRLDSKRRYVGFSEVT